MCRWGPLAANSKGRETPPSASCIGGPFLPYWKLCSEGPREIATPLGAATEALKCLWSIQREVGLFMEPGFKVCFFSYLVVVTAPETEYGGGRGAMLGSSYTFEEMS